jgi:hypothetical protein
MIELLSFKKGGNDMESPITIMWVEMENRTALNVRSTPFATPSFYSVYTLNKYLW